ncbi:MAG: hypothetical protein KatS3mg087_1635 [Patescibacteria group bacterium]|nr:MAG: hypothetical protein KatS3mg087_1635 [Patescibacteria group bacterium]
MISGMGTLALLDQDMLLKMGFGLREGIIFHELVSYAGNYLMTHRDENGWVKFNMSKFVRDNKFLCGSRTSLWRVLRYLVDKGVIEVRRFEQTYFRLTDLGMVYMRSFEVKGSRGWKEAEMYAGEYRRLMHGFGWKKLGFDLELYVDEIRKQLELGLNKKRWYVALKKMREQGQHDFMYALKNWRKYLGNKRKVRSEEKGDVGWITDEVIKSLPTM